MRKRLTNTSRSIELIAWGQEQTEPHEFYAIHLGSAYCLSSL
jgi:hypothetical protein